MVRFAVLAVVAFGAGCSTSTLTVPPEPPGINPMPAGTWLECDCTDCNGATGTTTLGGCAAGLDCADTGTVRSNCTTLCTNYGLTSCGSVTVSGSNCTANRCDACAASSDCPAGEACNTLGRVCGRACTVRADCGCDLCVLTTGNPGVCEVKAAGSTCADPRIVQTYLDRFYGAFSIALDATSTLTIARDGANGAATIASGKIELIARDCPGPMCTMRLNHLHADGTPFAIATGGDPISVGSSTVTTTRPFTLDALGGGPFVIPSRGIEILVGYQIGATRYGTNFLNLNPLSGGLDLTTGAFSVGGLVASGATNVTLALNGHVTNFPPTAHAGADRTVACTGGNGTTAVELDGSGSSDRSPGPGIAEWRWYEAFDRDTGLGTLLANGAHATADLAVGAHTLTLMVIDGAGAIDLSDVHVTVADDAPPVVQVTAADACLWPPNHKLALYELGAGLTATARSQCWGDVSSSATITGVRSSEPALIDGSGHTTPDVFFTAGGSAFCVRSERAGPRQGREYVATVTVVDASGVEGRGEVVISVPRDRGHRPCAHPVSAPLDDGDPRCAFAAAAPGAAPAPAPPRSAPGGGCEMGGAVPAAALALLLLQRRRRRS